MISAGEASGDAYGAALVEALDKLGAFDNRNLATQLVRELIQDQPNDLSAVAQLLSSSYGSKSAQSLTGSLLTHENLIDTLVADLDSELVDSKRLRLETIAAVGGKRLKEASVGVNVDSSKWGAVGIMESLFVAPKVYEGYQSAKSILRVSGPGVFVPIDYGFINIKLAKFAKSVGWKVLYFIPPGSWRRDKQGEDLPVVTDEIVTPFPWSAEILTKMGANTHYFGHPLAEMISSVPEATEREGIAILPGSRDHEVNRNMLVIAEALQGFTEPLKFAVASNFDRLELEKKWQKYGGGPAEFISGAHSVLKSSRAAIVCSGTATLEAALCECPTVVMYRVSLLMELEFRIRRPKFEYISLPNILLNEKLVPELLQHDASPERIRLEIENILEDGEARTKQLQGFSAIKNELTAGKVFERTAEMIVKLAGEIQSARKS